MSEPSTNAFQATCISVYEVRWPTGIDYSDAIPFLERAPGRDVLYGDLSTLIVSAGNRIDDAEKAVQVE